MSQFTEADSAVNRLSSAVTAFEKVLTEPEGTVVEMPVGAAQPSLAERLKRAIDAVTIKPAQAATQATTAAQQALVSQQAAAQSAADAANSAAATGYVAPPFPDVWAPLNDDLRLLAGVAPADTITVAGTSYPLPTKSMTFTRSTTATYIDKSGVLKTAAINEPRFEREGLLMEGQSANNFLNTDNPTSWNTDSSITKASIVDGTAQAATLQGTTTTLSSNLVLISSPVVSGVANDSFTISARFKGTSHRIRFRFLLDGSLVGDAYFDTVTGALVGTVTGSVTYTTTLGSDGYTYASATLTIATAGNVSGNIWFNGSANIPIGSVIYVQTPQFEKNPVATSYIPTAGSAATRDGDNCTLPTSGNVGYRTVGDAFNRTVSLEFSINRYGRTSGALDLLRVSNVTYDIIMRAAPSRLESFRSGSSVTPAISIAYPIAPSIYTQTIDRNNTLTTFYESKKGSVTASPNVPAGIPSSFSFSPDSAVVYHVRNLRIWHRVLSDIQIRGLR